LSKSIVLITISLIVAILGICLSLTGNATQILYKANYNLLSSDAKKQVECLAENIYFEAAHEPNLGKVAVAFVTLNRLKDGKFGSDICGVVKQKMHNVCQFSWWCQEREKAMSENKVLTNGDNLLYNSVRDVALYVYTNYERLEDPTKGALFYHADYVDPKWRNKERVVTIGRHIFYNLKERT
jgi:N-acetylmuramoyl-L-alanine amidase